MQELNRQHTMDVSRDFEVNLEKKKDEAVDEPLALSRRMEIGPRSGDKRSFLKTYFANRAFYFQTNRAAILGLITFK